MGPDYEVLHYSKTVPSLLAIKDGNLICYVNDPALDHHQFIHHIYMHSRFLLFHLRILEYIHRTSYLHFYASEQVSFDMLAAWSWS